MLRLTFVSSAIVLLLTACVLPTSVSRSGSAPLGLPTTVVSLLNAANIPADAVGAIVMRVSDGAVLLSHRAEAGMQPASTLKLVTSIVGLETLGPTYRGRAELRTQGELVAGTLHGDLVLHGVGNPDLDWQALQRMLQTLRHKGISEIDGDLVLDRQWFQPPRADLGMAPFDETPEFRYNVIPDALLLNMNLLKLDFESGDQQKTTGMRVSVVPAMDRVSVVSNMTFVDRACDDWEDGWKLPTVRRGENDSIAIELHGEFPKNCSATTEINILDRVDFADRMFRALWRNLGGTFEGRTRDSTAIEAAGAGTRLLALHRSRTLAEVTRDINKQSDNAITRMLYLSIGALANDESSTVTSVRAEKKVRAWFRQHGIDDDGMVLENASGLSRIERIRPRQLAQVLMKAYRSKWAPEFMASLPIVGVDGGMEKRLRDTPAAGHARIKTGSLRDVAAVAGFVPCASDQVCIVVALINHPLAKGGVARPILDALIDSVVRATP